jgi:hypothetical protein
MASSSNSTIFVEQSFKNFGATKSIQTGCSAGHLVAPPIIHQSFLWSLLAGEAGGFQMFSTPKQISVDHPKYGIRWSHGSGRLKGQNGEVPLAEWIGMSKFQGNPEKWE